MKKVLFVNAGSDPKDRTGWSGTPYSIYHELIKYFDVETYVTYHKESKIKSFFKRGMHKLFHTVFLEYHLTQFAKRSSHEVQKVLQDGQYDVVFSLGVANIAFLETNCPIIYLSDAVVADMIDYYWFHINKKSLKDANNTQKRAMENATVNVFSSEWAKRGAMNSYGIAGEKIEVVHFGANVEVTDFEHIAHDDINLLFVGVEWERKGGEIAVECVEELNKLDPSHTYHLHLAGCIPPYEIKSDYVTVYGFLNRNIKEQREKLDYLRAISDLFILPTKAECSALVFCEASAYSLPIITYDTGGVGDYVINGKNGYRLPLEASGKDFANKIIDILHDKIELEKMQKCARTMYEQEYNWVVFGNKIREIIERIS